MKDIAQFAGETVGQLDTTLKDVRIPRANLGPCPVCGQDIMENRKGYSCWSREDPGCGFVIWKGKAGKQLPAAVARELIRTGRTEKQVTGFRGRSGRTFRAKLALEQSEEGKWRVEFDEPWAKEGAQPPARTRPRRRRVRRRRRSARRGGVRPPPRSGACVVASSAGRCAHSSAARCASWMKMPLELVTGPANAEKAGYVLDGVARRCGRAGEPLLVVPTRRDVDAYRRELAADGVALGVGVADFAGLLREMARRAGVARAPARAASARARRGSRRRRAGAAPAHALGGRADRGVSGGARAPLLGDQRGALRSAALRARDDDLGPGRAPRGLRGRPGDALRGLRGPARAPRRARPRGARLGRARRAAARARSAGARRQSSSTASTT